MDEGRMGLIEILKAKRLFQEAVRR
jgi:hypothetical protein